MPQNYANIFLINTLTEIIFLAFITYIHYREKEREKYLLFWIAGFALLLLGDLTTFIAYLKFPQVRIFLRQIFVISSSIVFLWGVLSLRWGEKFKHKAEFSASILTTFLISLASEFIFKDYWKYLITVLTVPPIAFFPGAGLIAHAGRTKITSFSIFGIALMAFGILQFIYAFGGLVLKDPTVALISSGLVNSFLGFSIFLLILDRYRIKAVHIEKLYHLIVDVMNEALILLDTEEKIIYINNRFCQLCNARTRSSCSERVYLNLFQKGSINLCERKLKSGNKAFAKHMKLRLKI